MPNQRLRWGKSSEDRPTLNFGDLCFVGNLYIYVWLIRPDSFFCASKDPIRPEAFAAFWNEMKYKSCNRLRTRLTVGSQRLGELWRTTLLLYLWLSWNISNLVLSFHLLEMTCEPSINIFLTGNQYRLIFTAIYIYITSVHLYVYYFWLKTFVKGLFLFKMKEMLVL